MLSLCALIVLLGYYSRTAAAGPPATQPNVVVVVTDDQRRSDFRRSVMPKTMRVFGAGNGTTFAKAIVTTPLCCPSRASMITGQYAHNHGAFHGYRRLEDPANVLPVWLQEAGYTTAHVGKYLNGFEDEIGRTGIPPGWDRWHTTVAPRRYYDYELYNGERLVHFGRAPRDHVTRMTNQKAVQLAQRLAAKPAPFYLQVDHYAPHTGSGLEAGGSGSEACPSGPVPAPRDAGAFGNRRAPRPPSFDEARIADKPRHIRDLPRLDGGEERRLDRRHACRLESLLEVDRGVQRLRAKLAAAGELADTVFVFTSDNGFQLGEHRLVGKQMPYEESLRVPLLLRVPPGHLGGDPVKRVKLPVANIDIAPTLLELAGANPSVGGSVRTLDGRSLLSAIAGEAPGFSPERAVGIEFGRGNSPASGTRACKWRGVRVPGRMMARTRRVRRAGSDKCRRADEREIYDLRKDPFQLDNLLVTNPARGAALEAELLPKVTALEDCAGVAGRDPLPPSGHWCE